MADETSSILPHERPLPPRTDLWIAAVFLVLGAGDRLARLADADDSRSRRGRSTRRPASSPASTASSFAS